LIWWDLQPPAVGLEGLAHLLLSVLVKNLENWVISNFDEVIKLWNLMDCFSLTTRWVLFRR